MSLLAVVPMAVVMIAGPQILSAIFLAMSEPWRRNSAAFVAGAALSITLVVTIAYLSGNGATDQGASNDTLHLVVLALLLVAMVYVYARRKQSKPPKWMGRLQRATPKFSFVLGFLLLGLFPSDLLTSIAVGTYLAAHGEPWTHSLGFIALTLLFLSLPALALLAFGQRAEDLLPKGRDWINTHSWVVSEVVILFFIGMNVNSLLG
ncbi:GAP family protein [Halomarina pelagica]|uniref:GAP family protein n=1 Tax=Halomarina pelagica TaxID=2961599 RepID=UPI0020C546FF|nr:GAP family protein [Halomarina sp. BND7]